jgi:hypothetical protein
MLGISSVAEKLKVSEGLSSMELVTAKVTLSLWLINHHGMKTYGEWRHYMEVSSRLHAPDTTPPPPTREKKTHRCWIGDWIDPQRQFGRCGE